MAVEGTLDLFKLPEILQLISQQRKTGILTVQGQQDIIAISFLNGAIVAADALNQTVEEGLAQVLVKEGMVSAQAMSRASAEHQSTGGRLIDLLVERGYVERTALLETLRLQTHRLLEQLLRWSEGDFKFYSNDEVSYEEGFSPITVEQLLVHAAQNEPPPPPASPVLAAVPPPSVRAPEPAPVQPAAPRPGLRVVAREPAPAPAPGPVKPAPPVPVPAPADREEGPFRRMRVESAPAPPLSQGMVGKLLAAAFTVLLAAVLLIAPGALLLPFPWQGSERADLIREQRTALYLKIDRAAKTYFLLRLSFPDRLEDLVDAGLLSSRDLRDPEGHPIRYSAGEESYTLQPLADGKPVPGTEATEAITGNFLLDPEFLAVSSESTAPPLVLLD
jgi:hypothetical protein